MSALVNAGQSGGHAAPSRSTTQADHGVEPVENAREVEISEAFARYVEAGVPLWRYVARHPVGAFRTHRDIAALPAHPAELPPTAEAAAVQAQLLEHGTSRRAMLGVSAVLETPTTPGTYTDGHTRATVRRKIRAAQKQGVTVRPVPAEDRAELLMLANLHEQANAREEYRNTSPDNDDLLDYGLWLAAYDAHDEPIMLSVTPCAGEWGVLRYFRTLVPGQASSDARYLMARELAEALAARGVRRLVDSSRPHWLPNGLRHFQRMIGFRLIRIPTVHISER
jgi:hypothetical protein